MSAGPIPEGMRKLPLQKMPAMSDGSGPVKVPKKSPPPQFGSKRKKAY